MMVPVSVLRQTMRVIVILIWFHVFCHHGAAGEAGISGVSVVPVFFTIQK